MAIALNSVQFVSDEGKVLTVPAPLNSSTNLNHFVEVNKMITALILMHSDHFADSSNMCKSTKNIVCNIS